MNEGKYRCIYSNTSIILIVNGKKQISFGQENLLKRVKIAPNCGIKLF